MLGGDVGAVVGVADLSDLSDGVGGGAGVADADVYVEDSCGSGCDLRHGEEISVRRKSGSRSERVSGAPGDVGVAASSGMSSSVVEAVCSFAWGGEVDRGGEAEDVVRRRSGSSRSGWRSSPGDADVVDGMRARSRMDASVPGAACSLARGATLRG